VRDVLSLRHRHENTKLLQSHIDLHASGMNGRRKINLIYRSFSSK
jgi:hypothetical protein